MSTRCQFIIWEYNPDYDDYSRKLNFYHHHDGYPSYMEEDIKKVIDSVPDFKIETLKKAFLEYDDEYELERIDSEHGDIEYVWHLFVSDIKAELKYVDLRGADTEQALYAPHKCKNKFRKSWVKYLTPVENIEVELDNETYKKATEEAQKVNMTVDEYCSRLVNDAYKSGELEKILNRLLEKKHENNL